MKEYHKINTVWKRQTNKPCDIIPGDFATPEFEYLQNNTWEFTEKVDGTNIRVMWDGTTLSWGGKTDNAQIPTTLIAKLQAMFSAEQFTGIWPKNGELVSVCLYGEGYGAKIRKGGGNYRQDQSFVLFDVNVDGWWLRRDAVQDVASKLKIDVVPVVGEGTLLDACEIAKTGMQSSWGPFDAEGLVMRPKLDIFDRAGRRIISKIKTRDYRDLR